MVKQNTHDEGDLVRCSAVFTDEDGNLHDPTEVHFQIQPPTLALMEYEYGADAEVVKEGTGTYFVEVSCTESGRWWYRCYSTGTGQGAGESGFFVSRSRF